MQELTTELIHINAQLNHVKGRMRLDGQIFNNGTQPLEKIKITACFNRADISSIGPSGDTLHYLLPGQSYEVSIWLEPRVSAEDIKAGGFNLDIKNPNIKQAELDDPEHLLAELRVAESDVLAVRAELKSILAKALAG